MAWRVSWTDTAWLDLEDIADYIARDSPRYAAAVVQELREAAASLRWFAERGRQVPEFSTKELRELLVGNYRLIYQTNQEDVFILAVIHGARDLTALWRWNSSDQAD